MYVFNSVYSDSMLRLLTIILNKLNPIILTWVLVSTCFYDRFFSSSLSVCRAYPTDTFMFHQYLNPGPCAQHAASVSSKSQNS